MIDRLPSLSALAGLDWTGLRRHVPRNSRVATGHWEFVLPLSTSAVYHSSSCDLDRARRKAKSLTSNYATESLDLGDEQRRK
jgi:hypothetical protein